MKRENAIRVGTRIGGLIAFLTFLVVGLAPGLVYGGYFGAILAKGLMGHAVSGGMFARLVIAGGMALGALAVGCIMTVLGGVAGTIVASVVIPAEKEEEATDNAATKSPAPAETTTH